MKNVLFEQTILMALILALLFRGIITNYRKKKNENFIDKTNQRQSIPWWNVMYIANFYHDFSKKYSHFILLSLMPAPWKDSIGNLLKYLAYMCITAFIFFPVIKIAKMGLMCNPIYLPKLTSSCVLQFLK